MSPEVQRNIERILTGEIRYVSNNFGLNTLVGKLQRKVSDNPAELEESVESLDKYMVKYQSLLADELKKIAAL